MPMSNYPNGFANGVSVRGVPLLSAYPGNVYWVDSVAGSNGRDGTFQRPFASINYAVTKAAASKGDIIVVKSGHVETVTAAAGLAIGTADVAIIGLGSGSGRPTINFTTATTATMTVTAANVTLYNLLFTGGIDALAGPLAISGADCSIINCEYRDVTGEAVRVIMAAAGATRLYIENYFHNGAAAAGGTSAIDLIGVTNPVIKSFRLVGNFSGSAIEFRTTASVDVNIYNGYIWTKNSADLAIKDTITGTTGKIGPDLNFMLTDNAANITEAVTGATFHLFDPIYVCNLAGEKAMLINTTASTDA